MTLCASCEERGITSGRHWLGLVVMVLLEGGTWSIQEEMGALTRRTLLGGEPRPTHDLGELCTSLAERPPDRDIGYDSLDNYRAVEKIIRAAGLDPETWGICPDCKGSGKQIGE